MDAGKTSISEIFNGNRILEIPFFQRSYVWDTEQWARLLEDMKLISSTNKPYFLGSVIMKQQETTTSSSIGDRRTLIDGQQRLTTLNIFFKVLCLKLSNSELFDGRFRTYFDKSISLKHNHNDEDAFNHIVNLDELEEIDNPEEVYSHIKGAYNYFKKNMESEDYDFFKIISNVMFVGIDLNRDEDEQQIFDTINSLGVRLTTAELLKNHLFGRDDLKSYEDNWKSVFEKDAETKSFWDRVITAGRTKRENIDLFFYSFLQIKLQDKAINVSTEDKVKLGKFSGLFESYKEFMKTYHINEESLIKEIKEYAIVYRDNIDFDVIDQELTADFGIERINALIFGLDTTAIIPYVLYVLNNATKEEQNKIFMYLESYIMRRIIARSVNKGYNKLFSEELISNEITTKDLLQELIDKKSDKTNAMPSDEDVEDGFMNAQLVNKQTRGIIYLIESKVRDKSRHSTSLLGLDRYSLEHLMPKKWENNWAEVGTEDEAYTRDNKLLTLGNLAIITSSLNSSIRDSSWEIKVNGNDKRYGLIEYSSGLETISRYLAYPEWNEDTISERASTLYEYAQEIWTA